MRRVLGKWCGARPGGGGVTSSTVVGGARVPCRGCGAMSAGGQRRPPLRKRNKRCNGRATARVAPTKALQGVRRGERNPPVTALPCQPPLGKRAEGTGDADCHDQFANWSRNDTFSRSAVQARAGGIEPRPYETLLGMWEKNPLVTASPSQPPLGKGALGTGDADVPVAVPKISALPYGGHLKF